MNRLLESHRRARRSPSLASAAGVLALVVVTVQLRALPLIAEAWQAVVSTTESTTVRRSEFEVRGSSPVRGSFPVRGSGSQAPRSPLPVPSAVTLLETRGREAFSEESSSEEAVEKGSRSLSVAAPVTIAARSFGGLREPPVVSSIPVRTDDRSRWQVGGRAGVEVGVAARKAGVGVASTLTRASLSIARGF